MGVGTLYACLREDFFCLIILAFSLSRLWWRTFYPLFPPAVRAVAVCCKLPIALRPGLSQEVKRTKEITKERQRKETSESATP